MPGGPNPGRLPGGRVLIVINLLWLVKTLFHALISSLILTTTTHEREQFLVFLEVGMDPGG